MTPANMFEEYRGARDGLRRVLAARGPMRRAVQELLEAALARAGQPFPRVGGGSQEQNGGTESGRRRTFIAVARRYLALRLRRSRRSSAQRVARAYVALGLPPDIQEAVALRCGARVQRLGAEVVRLRNRIAEENLGLVGKAVAVFSAQRGLDRQDLFQEGVFGLLRAIDLYDPGRGFAFSTYAFWWIRQAMQRAVAREGRTIRLAVSFTDKAGRILGARERAVAAGEWLPVQELATRSGTTGRAALRALQPPHSVGFENADALPSATTPLDDALASERACAVRASLGRLPRVQGEVIRRRFALEGRAPETLQSIGTTIGCTREWVRQIERKALTELRDEARLREVA